MVGRSKPSKKLEPKQSIDFNTAGITFLKAKNVELAKALADSKTAYTQMVEDRDLLQRELFTMNLRCTKLENYIKNMQAASKLLMNSVVTSSNYATEILQNAHNALRLNLHEDNVQTLIRSSLVNGSPHMPTSSHKTQAVKPMIGGHVILRPTINLRRVNEIPVEEIRRLQSGDQVTNRNSSENNTSNTHHDNEAQDNITTNARRFTSQPVQSILESFGNMGDDEYMDETSEISDPPSETNNVLDTVQEEQEDNLSSESHLSVLPNSNNTSLNLSGSNSQVPLLSGVFRDVRVYLSPMQNVSQYLDPMQHVTTERGSSKTHKAQRSHSRHSSRTNGTSSSNSRENKLPVPSNSNVTTSSPSADDSFTATLDNSLLSSTRIMTPVNTGHTTLTKPEDLNWMDRSNNSSTPSFERYPKFRRVKRSSRISTFPRSPLLQNTNHTSDDPLEGPSNLLDTFDEETKNKINTLSGLGLAPTFLNNSNEIAKVPSSPASAVLNRRERRLSIEKAKKSLYVTKRSIKEKKKSLVVSTKVPKVLINRISTNKSNSESFKRRSSLDGSRNSLNNSNDQSSSSSSSTPSIVPVQAKPPTTLKKLKTSTKQAVEKNNESEMLVEAKKRGRPKRAAGPPSLKEPSLRKKMRRSK